MMMPLYALMTAARNEEKYLPKTIEAVLSQSILPVVWAIVSDRSTDSTNAIVRDIEKRHGFIKLINLEGDQGRDFARKVSALEMAFDSIRDKDFDYVANLDADVVFGPYFFESILGHFLTVPELGIAGGLIVEENGSSLRHRSEELNRVDGACQVFRRECYEEIGGYLPLHNGGEDTIAGIIARMNGWKVRVYPELEVHHLRSAPLRGLSMIRNRVRRGKMFYDIGYHPFFEVLRCALRISNRPRLIGSVLELYGYFRSKFSGSAIRVPREVVLHIRAEQVQRIRRELGRLSNDHM